MICTVVTTVTTVTVAGAMFTTTLAMVAVATLIGFLVVKELVNTSQNPRLKLMSRFFNVGILPLLMLFATLIITTIMGVLS